MMIYEKRCHNDILQPVIFKFYIQPWCVAPLT